jgi:hypothetical protein
MEGFTRKWTNVTWITDGQISAALFQGTGVTIINHLAVKRIVFSAVWDLNI